MPTALKVAARFDVGLVTMTPGAIDKLNRYDVLEAFVRHVDGDWGDLCEEDRQANEEALVLGLRLFSSYHDRDHTKFWIITEADRSATTILLPNEY